MKRLSKRVFSVFIILVSLVFPFADSYAQDNTNNILTYEKAVELAIKNSYDLKNLKLENDKLIIDTDNSREQFGNSLPNPALLAVYLLDEQKNMSEERTKKAEEFKKTSIAYDIKKLFVEINFLDKELNLLNKQIDNLQQKNKTMQLKYKYGMESKTNVKALELKLDGALKEKDSLKIKIKDSYIQLNKFTGMDWNDNLDLEEINYTFETIKDTDSDVSVKISKALNYDFNLFLAKQASNIKQKQLDLHWLNYIESSNPINQTVSQPYKSIEIDNMISGNTVLDVKEKVSNAVVSKYQALKTLEAARENLLIEKKKLEENKRILESTLNAGLGTKQEYNDLLLGIETIDFNLAKIEAQHSLLKYNYETPILATY